MTKTGLEEKIAANRKQLADLFRGMVKAKMEQWRLDGTIEATIGAEVCLSDGVESYAVCFNSPEEADAEISDDEAIAEITKSVTCDLDEEQENTDD